MNERKPLQVQITVERHDCPVTNAMSGSKSNYIIKRVNVGERFSKHLVEFENYEHGTANRLRKEFSKVTKIDEKRLWVDCKTCSSCNAISKSESIIFSADPLSVELISYKLLLPSENSLEELLETFASKSLKIDVTDKADYIVPEELTKRQTEILLTAYNRGYFDVDRKITLTELANEIGIKPSSLEDILRRGLKKVVEYYISNEL